ncbi:MAG: hypothetical protein LUH14_04555 [Clostridiaceae bacterium]|nr:hypothetical protein [Clostridiaceae bacterium]
MNILSIDFDFFIDTTITTRNTIFPSAEDAEPSAVKKQWDLVYQHHPAVKKIGVIPAYDSFCSLLPSLAASATSRIADSHREIYPFITAQNPPEQQEPIRIMHVDFHHDNYCMYGSTLTCANWLRKIAEKYTCRFDNVTWVRREDSETVSLEGDFPYCSTTDFQCVFKEHYDLIFLCLSPEWTPPHLLPYYKKMAALLQ